MHRSRLAQVDYWDASLRAAGVILASGSAVFAALMIYDNGDRPQTSDAQHLAIYAKPTRLVAANPPNRQERVIDDTPVGSIQKRRSSAPLSGYEIIEASHDSALLRLPEGRVMTVKEGSRIAGLGGVIAIDRLGSKWTLVTEGGVIQGAR